MTWIAGEVDGVAVQRRSIIGTGEWAAAKDKMIELLAAQLSDRFDLGDSIADSFADSGDVSGGVCTGGYIKNTETAAVASSNVIPNMTSGVPSGYTVSASSEYSPYYYIINAFDLDTSTAWYAAATTVPQWVSVGLPTAIVPAYYKLRTLDGYAKNMPKTWTFQGSNNGSSWTTLDSRSNVSWTSGVEQTFSISTTTAYRYYRLYATAVQTAGQRVAIGTFKIYNKAVAASDDPTTITVTPYTPDNTLEKVRVTLMLQDMDNTGALAVGSSSSDLIQAYLSYDGNSSFGSALGFSEEPEEFTAGSNIYVFNSNEVDVSAESISSLGLKLQSFDRGSGAPAFRWHAYIIAGKESA